MQLTGITGMRSRKYTDLIFWEFPGGKVEEGETPHECLQRELAEELGVRASAGPILCESPYVYEHGSFNLLAIETTLEMYNFFPKVHDRIEWVEVGALLDYELLPADIPIAEKLIWQNVN